MDVLVCLQKIPLPVPSETSILNQSDALHTLLVIVLY